MAYSISNQTPSAGYVSWTDFNIQYKGTSYSITDGSSNKIFIYWELSNPTIFQGSDTMPSLTVDDVVVIVNKNGVGLIIPTASVVDGGLIVDGSILTDALSANCVTAEKILAGTISSTEIAADAIGATQIAAGAVTANKIKAGEIATVHISAAGLDAEVITSGMVLSTDGNTYFDLDNAEIKITATIDSVPVILTLNPTVGLQITRNGVVVGGIDSNGYLATSRIYKANSDTYIEIKSQTGGDIFTPAGLVLKQIVDSVLYDTAQIYSYLSSDTFVYTIMQGANAYLGRCPEIKFATGIDSYENNFMNLSCGWHSNLKLTDTQIILNFSNPTDGAIGFYFDKSAMEFLINEDTIFKLDSDGIVTISGGFDLSKIADSADAATHYYIETASGNIVPKTLANVKTELVTKTAIEAVLTGEISSHSHASSGVSVTTDLSLTAQSASISTTNLAGSQTAGRYRVNWYLLVTTAASAGSTIIATFSFTDDVGATTESTGSMSLETTGRRSGQFYAQVASGAFTYATTCVNVGGDGRYALYVTVERVA